MKHFLIAMALSATIIVLLQQDSEWLRLIGGFITGLVSGFATRN